MGLLTKAAAFVLAMSVPSEAQRVVAKVYPSVVMAGQSVKVTCTVEPNAANRWLTMGVANYRWQGRQLEGEDAAITHQQTWDRVPCDSGPAFCLVQDANRKQHAAEADLLVVGCEGQR